jgi:hypothetical protein
MKAEIPLAYAWLKDALQPYGIVFGASANNGNDLAIGVASGGRRAIRVIESDRIHLNAQIAANDTTRDAVLQDLLETLRG